MPRASVLLTAYNGEEYVASAVRSALLQDEKDIEVIAVADGCTDNTVKILEGIGRTDSRLKVLDVPRVGRGGALNLGLARVTSPFAAILDADDYAFPGRINCQLSAFGNVDRSYACLGTKYRVFSDLDAFGSFEESPAPTCEGTVIDVTQDLRRHNPVVHSSVLMRTEAVNGIGGYSINRLSQYDYDLYIRLAGAGFKIGRLQRELVGLRQHNDRYFASGDQFRYRWNSIRTQVSALRAVPGPRRDSLIIPAKVVAIPLSSRDVRSRLGSRFVHRHK